MGVAYNIHIYIHIGREKQRERESVCVFVAWNRVRSGVLYC